MEKLIATTKITTMIMTIIKIKKIKKEITVILNNN